MKGLLNRNPKHRLGAQNDAQDLKDHPFFNDMDWDALAHKRIAPVFKPLVESNESVANFDPEFTNADIREVAGFPISEDELEGLGPSSIKAYTQSDNTTPNGVDIKKKERKSENEPLSKSIQEKFRGFSYSGTYESSVDALERGVNAIDWGKDVEEDAVV